MEIFHLRFHNMILCCRGQRMDSNIYCSFTVWRSVVGSWFVTILHWTVKNGESLVFPAVANIDVSKRGALINFSSGEAPFLEVQ